MCSVRHLSEYLTWRLLAFVGGTITLLYIQGCNGPALKPWHTEKLSAEFTSEQADEIDSFDAYRRLEDELFSQLEEQVYAGIAATGPAYALVRYSAGSAVDPLHRQPNWNRSFELHCRLTCWRGTAAARHDRFPL